MKRILTGGILSALLVVGGLQTSLRGQSFTLTGSNLPGATRDFPINIPAGVTNVAISIDGTATGFSHLLLRAGAVPTDTTYDFIASLDGQPNAINLETPQLTPANYTLRVRTPLASLAHPFTVTVSTNLSGLRTAALPATKPLAATTTGDLTAGTWHYYRVEVPADQPGWRVVLNSSGNNPDLYVRREAVPITSNFLRRSLAQTNDIVAFAANELTPGAYFIGVHQSSGTASYQLRTELISFTTLTWDPGQTHQGTQVYTHPNALPGDYYFKITTENTSVAAWRTALNVASGEANIFLGRGTPPSLSTNLFKSERVGSDGFVVPGSSFGAGEDWYFMVRVESGAQWNLVSGEPYVADLGTVAADAASGSGEVAIGAEGYRFFRTMVPADTLGWRLWLNGLTNPIYLRRTSVPLAGANEQTQPGQLLVVPSYLVGGQSYFVSVAGNPGTLMNLDSRQQAFADLPFAASTNLVVNGYGYTTFRVQVPPDQLAWQVNVVVTNGNPNVAVRRNFIPSEKYNDAYSEVAGTVSDSITLVPPTLSDGTFFVTVYSTNNYSCTLQSGNPEFTEISFTSSTTNLDVNRVGWRFFKVSDINQQLGALGWDLFITNYAPGTRIALRRNAAPGIWSFRDPDNDSEGAYDFLSAGDFLQRPGHQADIWYVGVYNPTTALGSFTLVTRELTAHPLGFNGGSATRAAVPAGKWEFFRFDVPANTLGWDLRLNNVTSGRPQLVVRRELLPTSLARIGFPGTAIVQTNWPTGHQWQAAGDWTGRTHSTSGALDETGRILTMGYGRPLEAGIYYVGVFSATGSTEDMTYTLTSRGIGPGLALPVKDVAFNGGRGTNTALAAREIDVYRVTIPPNTPSWKVRLAMLSGDATLSVARERVPNITAANNGVLTNLATAGKRMAKVGNEHLVLLPGEGQTSLVPGEYYLLVAGEGVIDPGFGTRIGSGTTSYLIESQGLLPEVDLGLLEDEDLIYASELEGGEVAAFHFHNSPHPETLGFELSLEDRLGNPVMVSRGDMDLADPGAASTGTGVPAELYGNEGGQDDALQASPGVITVADPYADETVMLMARGSGNNYTDASYTLRVRKLVPAPLAFDGGVAEQGNQTRSYEFYRVDVPAGALGWDLRLTDVTEGSPKLIICREYLALSTASTVNPGAHLGWSIGGNLIAGKDYTQRTFSADGSVNEDGRIVALGMGQPLEPGTYYVGVHNPNFPQPASYTLRSRGIGDGFLIPVVDVPFAGGSVTNLNVAPREAAYYRVVVPANARSWQGRVRATAGEALLVQLTNYIPGIATGRGPTSLGRAMQKTGNEHFIHLPLSPATTFAALTNYFAVVSEGTGSTNANRIGTGTSSFVFDSRGELAPINLGTAGTTDLTHAGTLEGGEVRAYQFTVPAGMNSLEAQLLNPTGIPVMVLRSGADYPDPGAGSATGGTGSVGADAYGNFGGQLIALATGNANTNLISVANPAAGTYTILVKARGSGVDYPAASYTLVVRATSFIEVAFDGGTSDVVNQSAGTWRYFRVEVPSDAVGWDVRLANVTAGLPKLVVRRDLLPISLAITGWTTPATATSWPTGNQWAAGADWTRRTSSANNAVNEDGRILAMGMGQPLEAGVYYVGVINSSGANAMSYTLISRGIGNGRSIPVVDLAYAGGTATVTDLPAREAAYFRVLVPTGTPAWKAKVATSAGEAMLLVLSNRLANVDTGRKSGSLNGKFMQKAGNEHYLALPQSGQSEVASGAFYLAVVSEGVNPASSTQIGSGSSTFTVTSVGDVPVSDLGTISTLETARLDVLEGGESRVYRFTVASNAPAIELRLDDRVGNPVMVASPGTALPDPGARVTPTDTYGNEGGLSPASGDVKIVTIPNPLPGAHTLVVKARASGSLYPNASYSLRARQVSVIPLNFSAEFNTNGLSHIATGQLLDNQRAFYRVVVPTNVNDQPVIGWMLDLAQTSGEAGLRVRRDLLPADAPVGMPFAPQAAAITAPFLTNGTWYVELRGTNTTAFTLTSSALQLQRPAWEMPLAGEPSTTPGLVAPEIGDSGFTTNGVVLPGDGGIDLELGRYHFYAVTVPSGNGGLLRVQLEGISGNPDIYLRTNFPPTVAHDDAGVSGVLYDRSLTGTATEYGNFVPLNGRVENELQPGTWYLAVRAVANANARYRLKLSTGTIQDLALNGGVLPGQVLAGNDWRYYRVQVPDPAPVGWQLSFNQEAGDVVMHLRDVLPPGNGVNIAPSQYRDWATDQKNSGPYASYDAAGTYTFGVPPVRPGNVYYVGIRAKNDSTFSIASATIGGAMPQPTSIAFYGGSVNTTIPPNSELVYRIVTPPDGLRWRHTSVHSNTVQVYIENGTHPLKISTDDFRSTTANSSLDRFLISFPWLPKQVYYLYATNTTALSQPFSLTMNGSSVTADDDGDGIPDAWELQYFGSITPSGVSDSDGDGVINLHEYLEGTDPTDRSSLYPRLTVVAVNGQVTVNPEATNYVQGTTITLTPAANVGFSFLDWTGSATGPAIPLVITIHTNMTITPRFRVPGDDFDQRIPLSGYVTGDPGLPNAGASKQAGEPSHGGNSGGKSLWWTWTAPGSGTVTATTAGSTFRNALGVYTGASVNALTLVTGNLAASGATTALAAFEAVGGTAYHFAVDGFGGAAGTAVLSLSISGSPPVLGEAARGGDGLFRFTITSEPGLVLDIDGAENLGNWSYLRTVTNVTGTLEFVDPTPATLPRRFYRGNLP